MRGRALWILALAGWALATLTCGSGSAYLVNGGSGSAAGVVATLSAPTLTSHPSGYAGGETVQMKYSGLASQPTYTSTQQTIPLGILPLTDLIINMQVVNANGFVEGDYTAKTVLTCS